MHRGTGHVGHAVERKYGRLTGVRQEADHLGIRVLRCHHRLGGDNRRACSTITHILLASAATVATTNQVDNADVTDIVFSAQGQAVVTPTFTVT